MTLSSIDAASLRRIDETPARVADMAADHRAALGLDVGGTSTRWALLAADGASLGGGEWRGLNGVLWAAAAAGADHDLATDAALDRLLQALLSLPRPPAALCAGITGCDREAGARLAQRLAARWRHHHAQPPLSIEITSDIEMACRGAFAPGAGYLVYAGTGSIAGFLDADGQLHRVGGRGVLIDDAGGAHWIAVQALRAIWRAEDAAPGAWRRSALARRVLPLIGGDDWTRNRTWLARATRGDVGLLARAVAAVDDAESAALLDAAGRELARLVQALLARFGPRPVALAGRAFALSPRIESALRAALPQSIEMHAARADVEMAAAQRALAGLRASISPISPISPTSRKETA